MTTFAEQYADLNERDYEAFTAAIDAGSTRGVSRACRDDPS